MHGSLVTNCLVPALYLQNRRHLSRNHFAGRLATYVNDPLHMRGSLVEAGPRGGGHGRRGRSPRRAIPTSIGLFQISIGTRHRAAKVCGRLNRKPFPCQSTRTLTVVASTLVVDLSPLFGIRTILHPIRRGPSRSYGRLSRKILTLPIDIRATSCSSALSVLQNIPSIPSTRVQIVVARRSVAEARVDVSASTPSICIWRGAAHRHGTLRRHPGEPEPRNVAFHRSLKARRRG